MWTVSVNCAHWRGSMLAIYKTVQITFPLNLQTITITLDVVKWRWGGIGSQKETATNTSMLGSGQMRSHAVAMVQKTFWGLEEKTVHRETRCIGSTRQTAASVFPMQTHQLRNSTVVTLSVWQAPMASHPRSTGVQAGGHGPSMPEWPDTSLPRCSLLPTV